MKSLVKIFQLSGLFILMFLLVSCSSNQKLEELGYVDEQVIELKSENLDKLIIKNSIDKEQYTKVVKHKSFVKENKEYYLIILSSVYEIDELDKIIIGVNYVIKNDEEYKSFFELGKDDLKNKMEDILKPTLKFTSVQLSAQIEGESDKFLRGIIYAQSKFGENLIQDAVITSDLNISTPDTYMVKVEVQDSKGYFNLIEQEITVTDNVPPKIEVPETIDIFTNESLNLLNYVTAVDNLDGDVTGKIEIDNGNLNINKAGKYSIKFKVKDLAGNEGVDTTVVNILPSVNYKESFEINKYLITVNSCTYNRTDSEPSDYYYQYYNAGEDQTFLICKIQIKNENDIQRSPFEIFGNNEEKLSSSLIYDGKYEYDSVAHGLDNNWYDTFMSLKPLTSNTKNLTFEVPVEIQDADKSVVLRFSSYKATEDAVYLKIK